MGSSCHRSPPDGAWRGGRRKQTGVGGGMQGRWEGDPIRVLLDYGGLEVVGQTDNDEGAVELARLRKPDVVLMQVQMPLPRTKENLLRMLEVSDPAPKVVIVTVIDDPREVRELMELGASAYIVKSTSTE